MINIGVEGSYTIRVIREDAVRVLSFSNLITDAGLEYLASTSNENYEFKYLQIGSGSTPPTEQDLVLDNFVASTQAREGVIVTSQSSDPIYTNVAWTYRFPELTQDLIISEIGVGGSVDGMLFSRTLIKDESGVPTELELQVGDILDVTYQLRVYPDLVDVVGTVDINGTTYTYRVRPCGVNQQGQFGWGLDTYDIHGYTHSAYGQLYAFTSGLGTVFDRPAGSSFGANAAKAWYSYTPGSHQTEMSFKLQLEEGNNVSGIRSIAFRTQVGCYQIEFTPNIMKTDAQELTFRVRQSWGRYGG